MKVRHLVPPALGIACGLLVGWVVFPAVLYTSREQPVQFSHAVHTGEAVGMQCTDCHVFSDDGRFAGVPALAKCAECHTSVVGSTDAEKHFVENYVQQNKEVPWLVYARQPDNAYFPHAAHVKRANITCERCHGPHGTSTGLRVYQENRLSGYSRDIWGPSEAGFKSNPWDGMKMSDCIDCHRGYQKDRACLDCHK